MLIEPRDKNSNIKRTELFSVLFIYFTGKTKEATALQLNLLPLINATFSDVNPIPIKALLSKEGFCKEEYRLPLCPLNEEKKQALFDTWNALKL